MNDIRLLPDEMYDQSYHQKQVDRMKLLLVLLIDDVNMRKVEDITELIKLLVYFRCGINTGMRIQLF